MTIFVGVFSVRVILPPLIYLSILAFRSDVISYLGMFASDLVFSGNIVYTYFSNF